MATPSKKEIAARAYKLWEQNGQPEGREDEFWHLAEQELLNEDKSYPLRQGSRRPPDGNDRKDDHQDRANWCS
jgi:hypothetical protein